MYPCISGLFLFADFIPLYMRLSNVKGYRYRLFKLLLRYTRNFHTYFQICSNYNHHDVVVTDRVSHGGVNEVSKICVVIYSRKCYLQAFEHFRERLKLKFFDTHARRKCIHENTSRVLKITRIETWFHLLHAK